MNISPEELLEEYRKVTPNMTEEKYNYLKENVHLAPTKMVSLALLKRKFNNPELIARAEYASLFEAYANRWEKTWNKMDWGEREDEGLYEFAEGALEESIARHKTK